MRETRLSGSEGGGTEFNRSSLPLSKSARDAKIFTISSAAIRDKSLLCFLFGLRVLAPLREMILLVGGFFHTFVWPAL